MADCAVCVLGGVVAGRRLVSSGEERGSRQGIVTYLVIISRGICNVNSSFLEHKTAISSMIR